MAKQKYPLEQVLAVKHDRVRKAEKVVEEKKIALAVEEEKLHRLKEMRDAAKQHYADKLAQLRAALDGGTTSDEVLQMKAYLEVAKERLAKEEEKVKKQEEQVKIAEKNLADAKADLKQKRMDEEKLVIHRQEWEKEMKRELAREEAKEHDEIGQLMYESHKRQKRDEK
ncbi:MAG: type III secretion T3S chaperone [Chlamydiales bacterium]